MPLLDHFRMPRLGKRLEPAPAAVVQTVPVTRLDRMVARQKGTRLRTDLERRLDALEEEYAEPLYGTSAYSSPVPDSSGD